MYFDCKKCQQRIRQIGNRTGHCANCHETYIGEAAWNNHYHMNFDTGEMFCRSPVLVEGKWWLDDEGYWHYGKRLTAEDKERIWG